MKYYLGVDNGGTLAKAAIFNENGTELASAAMNMAMLVPYPGFTERNMEKMQEINCKVIQKVLSKSRISNKEINCVTVCGHGKGLYLWGKDNRPVRNGIISTDNRAWKYPLKWKRDGIEDKVFALLV